MLFEQTTGRTPFLRKFKKMKEKSEIEFFKLTRSKKGGEFVNPAAKLKYDEMVDMRNKGIENDENDGEPISESQIVKATLGHKSGYIKGMGHELQASCGVTSNMIVGIDIKEKLSELDRANGKIIHLTNKCEEQGNSMDFMKTQMLKWEKILERCLVFLN
ncbi:hypothetical protein OROHE_000089 [Orobanche hederae]